MIIQIFSALVKETGETINKIRRYILFENLLLCRYQMHHPRSLFTSINVCHPPSLHHLHHHPLHIQRRPQFPVCGLSFATFLRLNLRTTARRPSVSQHQLCGRGAERSVGGEEQTGTRRSARSGPSQSLLVLQKVPSEGS